MVEVRMGTGQDGGPVERAEGCGLVEVVHGHKSPCESRKRMPQRGPEAVRVFPWFPASVTLSAWKRGHNSSERLAARLKDKIISAQPPSHDAADPPANIPDGIRAFLGAAVDFPMDYVDGC
ncbi:hypothetical protein B0H19DRAFT_1068086 [Mycena capillaripes]|nr:hypothetical protein B0H19DRAFT_1068086 [Mycena capillaripes]